MLSGIAQRNTPEFPACFRWRHCTTSSRFVTIFLLRITPTGLPVHLMRPLFSNVHVSGLQLTAAKSSSVIARQPGPVPLMKALGADSAALRNPANERDKAREQNSEFMPET